MLGLFFEFIRVLRDCIIGSLHLFFGSKTVTVQQETQIRAPRNVVWNIATMLTGRLEGTPPIEYRGEILDDEARVFRQTARLGEAEWETTFRVVEDVDLTSRTIEIVETTPIQFPDDVQISSDGTGTLAQSSLSSNHVMGGAHHHGFEIVELDDGGTKLKMFHTVEHPTLSQLISLPMTMRLVHRRIKDRCEALAGTTNETNPIVAEIDEAGERYGVEYDNLLICVAAAGLTFGCFGTVYGWAFALLLLTAMAFNDYCYRASRKLLGLRDNLIFAVPFARSFAMEIDEDGTAGERVSAGLFASLFSAIPTAGLFLAFTWTGQGAFGVAATIFALLNLAYLIPIMPLDGGRLMCAVGEAMKQQTAIFCGWCAAILAGFVAIGIDSGMMAIGVAIAILQLALWANPLDLLNGAYDAETPEDAMTLDEATLAIAGYAALVCFYVAVLFGSYGDPVVATLYEPATLMSENVTNGLSSGH